MSAFIQRLRAAWIFSRIHPHIEGDPVWTKTDADALTNFLVNTLPGKKLRLKLWRNVQSCAFHATIERNHATFECGYASGARGLASVIDSLLRFKAEEPADKPQTAQEEDLDALRP